MEAERVTQHVEASTRRLARVLFLSNLYDMVDDDKTNEIVEWSDGNDGFIINDREEFSKSILPKYFKLEKFESFRRQLNYYGFKKVSTDRLEYAHVQFLRGRRYLLNSIKRRTRVRLQKMLSPNEAVHEQSGSSSQVSGADKKRKLLDQNDNALFTKAGTSAPVENTDSSWAPAFANAPIYKTHEHFGDSLSPQDIVLLRKILGLEHTDSLSELSPQDLEFIENLPQDPVPEKNSYFSDGSFEAVENTNSNWEYLAHSSVDAPIHSPDGHFGDSPQDFAEFAACQENPMGYDTVNKI